MEHPQFHIHEYSSQWELYYGITTGAVDEDSRAGKCVIRAPKAAQVPEYYPDAQMNELLLERLNGFPKAIEFIQELLNFIKGNPDRGSAKTRELIEDFLKSVPHVHSSAHIETEPEPREFDVTIARTTKATVNIVATSREEAEVLVWEHGDQIGDAFDLVNKLEGDEAYEETVVDVRLAEEEETP